MSKHTPGPWLDLGLESPWGYVIKHNGGSSISYIAAYDLVKETPEPYGKWDANSIANRSLVLAAPDLLEALKDLIANTGINGTFAEKALAAIAKAEG